MKSGRLTSSPEKQREWERRSRRGIPRTSGLRQRGRNYARSRREQFGEKAAWIRLLPCLSCGTTPSDPHHEPPRSLGGKSRDMVPLCRPCHGYRHHAGIRVFDFMAGTDLIAEASRLEEKWRAA